MASEKPFGLYIPKKGKTYVYDFWVENERYNRSTRETSFEKALKVAAKVYADAIGAEPAIKRTKRKPEITLDAAFDRFYEERGIHDVESEALVARLARIAERLGPGTFLSRVTMDDLLKYQVRRRKDGVANRTINSDVPESLRRVVVQARHWGVELGALGDPGFDWKALKQPLPAPRTRYATRPEKAKLLWHLRKEYRRIIMFALLSGLRKSALLLRKSQIDWDARVIRYNKKSRTRHTVASVPITRRIESLLRYECAKDPEGEWVFTYVCQRAHKGYRKGHRYPITTTGLRKEMEKAVRKAELENWRLIHDLRHTAATDVLRGSRNIAAVRDMLGHSDVAQTERYAHVLNEAVVEAMEQRRR